MSKKRPADWSALVSLKVQKLVHELSHDLKADTARKTEMLHLRDLIMNTLDEHILPPLGYFGVLAAEMVHEILCRLPVSDWVALACTCHALQRLVHGQAKHYFQRHCGSQKIAHNTSFLPQLVGVCQHQKAVLVAELAQKPPTLIVLLGSYSAQVSPFKSSVPPAWIWDKALQRGLSDVVIRHLVARLSVDTNFGCMTAASHLLAILNSGADDRDVKRVARAILHVLASGPSVAAAFLSSDSGRVIVSFVRHADKEDEVIKQAFCGVLMLFDIRQLLRCIMSACEPASDIAQAVTFVFDTARRYHLVLPRLYLKFLTCEYFSKSKLCKTVAACPDLMALPYDDNPKHSILDTCHGHDPIELIRSPWFVLPDDVQQIRAMMRAVLQATSSTNTQTLTHFCSLLSLAMLRQVPFGKLITKRIGTDMALLEACTQAVGQVVPFSEWTDCVQVIGWFFFKGTNFRASREFFLRHVDARVAAVRAALSLGMQAQVRGKKQLRALCQKLLSHNTAQ